LNSDSSSSNRRSSVIDHASRDTGRTLSRRRRWADVLVSNRRSWSESVSHLISPAWSPQAIERGTHRVHGRARRNGRLHQL